MKSTSDYLLSLVVLLLALTLLASCGPSDSKTFDEAAWKQDVEEWHNNRISELKKEDGWLTLAGFYWLDEGRSSFGGSRDNDHVFDHEKAPDHIGWFLVDGDEVHVEFDAEVEATVNGEPARRALVYGGELEEPADMDLGPLYWYIIERSDRHAIRLRDREHPRLAQFDEIERYPVTAEWRVEAEFIPFDPPIELTIPNYIGEPTRERILGALEFEHNGETHRLYPVADNLDERFFIIFADETNREETYSGGRFVYTDPPDNTNTVYIDFNQAYNPPCVFSEYATCPLPPPENRLPFAIPAGELDYEPAGS